MRDVLGFELGAAVKLLEGDGVKVTLLEVSSRKGLRGSEQRVIRMTPLGGNEVELAYAVFRTDVDQEG